MPTWLIMTIGFTAQALFSARILVQWISSEKSKKLESPLAYWVLSVIGSYTMFAYGVLRDDFSIVVGQLVSYYIYLWNLDAKGVWRNLAKVWRVILVATPVVCVGLLARHAGEYVESFFQNEGIPIWLVVFGTLAQLVFALRFVWQWWVSKRSGESIMPVSFWVLSAIGSGSIIIYALFRLDIVLIVGQAFGFAVYLRNIWIGLSAKNKTTTTSTHETAS